MVNTSRRWMRGLAVLVALGSAVLAGCGKDKPDGGASQAESTSSVPKPENDADRVLADIIGHFQALNYSMTRISDEKTAHEQVPEVKRIVDELHKSLLEGQQLPPEEKAKSTTRYQEFLDAQTQEFSRNIGRLMTIQGASAPIIQILESMPSIEPDAASTPSHIDLSNPPQGDDGGTGDQSSDGGDGHGH
ncbi:MAG: hypothetical protein KC729_05525 [Candidatus Eisenbacteria bacterium]|uniref:YlbF family regulator n=1 Tax=Eiseniibacteriota bacterium TaxID=2212470 RepID=A0A956RPX6_UNCEI|nr:hypothetical protein [Candidatus Eisenbacteria bacterium]